MGFARNRVTLELTYYTKKVDDLLLNVQVPTASGFTFAWKNVAAIKNQGVEIGLNAIPVDKNGWRWTSEINFWKNTAKVTRLDVPALIREPLVLHLERTGYNRERALHKLLVWPGRDDKIDPESGLAFLVMQNPIFKYHLWKISLIKTGNFLCSCIGNKEEKYQSYHFAV